MEPSEFHFEILPAAQKRLWPDLSQVPPHFVLYGGTAAALQLGHRTSMDFDFFTSESFVPIELMKQLPLLEDAKVLQNVAQTLTVSVTTRGEAVKLSFFGKLPLGRVGQPQLTPDGVAKLASLLDLAGTKAAVITQRAELKDYLDLLALVRKGINLAQAMGAARSIYGHQYNPLVTLKSLTFFGDGDLHKLTHEQKSELIRIAAATPMSLPEIPRISDTLS